MTDRMADRQDDKYVERKSERQVCGMRERQENRQTGKIQIAMEKQTGDLRDTRYTCLPDRRVNR